MIRKQLLENKPICRLWCLVFVTFSGIILCITTYSLLQNVRSSFYMPVILSTTFNDTKCNCSINPQWIYDMHTWTNKKGPYSQGSQDFYLEKIFSVIQITNKYFIEFGFNEPSYISGGTGANTRRLYENGWRGLLLDGDRENPQINLKKYFLFANNIAAILAENNVPKHFDYLSCDMDSHDLWVLRSILQAGYRPRVITTEYNSNYSLNDTITLIDPTMLQDTSRLVDFKFKFQYCAWGAGAGALRFLTEAHGYTLVGRISYLDLIWVRNDLLQKACTNLPTFEWFFRDASIGQLHHQAQSSPEVLSQLVDYETFVQTGGNINASNQAARNILKKRNLPCYAAIRQFL